MVFTTDPVVVVVAKRVWRSVAGHLSDSDSVQLRAVRDYLGTRVNLGIGWTDLCLDARLRLAKAESNTGVRLGSDPGGGWRRRLGLSGELTGQ